MAEPSPEVIVTSNSPEEADLTVRVYEYDDEAEVDESGDEAVERITDFRVVKKVLWSKSSYFAKMFASNFREAKASTIELRETTFITTEAIEIWFRTLHNTKLPDGCYEVPRSTVWHLAAAADKYKFDLSLLKGWFTQWYLRNEETTGTYDSEQAAELLYPCWVFNHIAAFGKATKFLAYNSTGHIMERNPTTHRHIHLPPRIIQQLNFAKGRLRIVLFEVLWGPMEHLLKGSCSCKEKTIYGYQKALFDGSVWPLERAYRKASMTTILNRLNRIKFKPANACTRCHNSGFTSSMQSAHDKTLKYFDGLCLLCMDRTNEGDKTQLDVYWDQGMRNTWDMDCRNRGFSHGDASWYFSYMGQEPFQQARLKWRRAVYDDVDD